MEIFSRYEKIVESASAWQLDAAGFRALRRVLWGVTEKIHGANFCFVITDNEIKGANRRRLLAEEEPFFAWQSVRDRLQEGLRDAFCRVRAEEIEVVERLFIYGELFGGGYPHPNIAPVSGVAPIQTGVWYAPDIHFQGFDIAIEIGGKRRYLDFERTRSLLLAAGVPCVALLCTGTYEQVQDFPIRFDSTVPAMLGLPPLPTGSNLAEGVVLRSLREIAITGASGPIRPLRKHKLPEFAEDRRFHQAQPWTIDNAATAGGALDRLKWEAYCRITENRLDTALSKVGPRPLRHRSHWARELFAVLIEDIRTEAQIADNDSRAALSLSEQRIWEAYIREEVGRLLKTRFGSGTRR